MNCRRCGQCCENMALSLSPKELRDSFNRWDNEKKYPRGVVYSNIHLIYPMLVYKGYDKKIKRYRYRCKHFIRKNGKGCCTIHHIKPKLCSNHGTDGKMTMGSYKLINKNFYPNCVF